MHIYNINDWFLRYHGFAWGDESPLFKVLQKLPPLSVNGPWLCGGAVRSIINGEKIKDYDIFFASKEQMEEFQGKITGIATCLRTNKYNSTWTLTEDQSIIIQLIQIWYEDSIAKTLDHFDFSLCQCGFDGTSLYFGQHTLFDIANKKLVPEKIEYGVSSIRRIIKYTNKNYTICSGGIQKILEQIANNPSVIQSNVTYID